MHRDGVRVPQRRGVAEDDAGERHAVGVVDHQRNVALLRQQVELHQLFVGDHVAGRVGRPRNADHADVVADGEVFEINVIFELAVRQQLDVRFGGDEQPFVQPGVGIADVFRRQQEQHAAARTVGVAAGEQVEQSRKTRFGCR